MDLAVIAAAVLAGGGGGALINVGMQFFTDRKRLKKSFYEEQLRNLYGPIYYLVIVNEKMFKLSDSHQKATTKTYFAGDKEWSQGAQTQEHLRKVSEDSINIANSFIETVKENNEEIKKILDKNYSYIDPEDTEYFAKFLQDYHRFHKEIDGKLKTDLHVYFELEKEIGSISWMDKKFAERIKDQFEAKQQKIRKLAYCDPQSLL